MEKLKHNPMVCLYTCTSFLIAMKANLVGFWGGERVGHGLQAYNATKTMGIYITAGRTCGTASAGISRAFNSWYFNCNFYS